MGRIQQLARTLGLDRNPLRRRTDRLQTATAVGLGLLFLICAPIVAVAGARWTHGAGLAQQRTERAWHQVTAVALQSAQPSADGYAAQWEQLGVLARWVAPSGAQRMGEVPAPASILAGQPLRIWVNGSGWPIGPPLSPRQLATRDIGVAALLPTVLAALLLAVGWLARWLLNRRKITDWETAWAQVEPQWSKQR